MLYFALLPYLHLVMLSLMINVMILFAFSVLQNVVLAEIGLALASCNDDSTQRVDDIKVSLQPFSKKLLQDVEIQTGIAAIGFMDAHSESKYGMRGCNESITLFVSTG